jgi:hypothetical protein
MNDRQRLEAIVWVVCRYLPPDGIPVSEAMSQIIALVDPLPESVPLTDEQIEDLRSEANRGFCIEREDYFKAFRDAEAAHGITKGQP